MSGQVSLLQIVSTVMIALTVVNLAAAKTDWKAMSFEAFVEEHADVKGKELAGQYRAAGVKMLSSMVGQGAYRNNRKDPVELYLQDFKQWCVAHDGVFATFPSKAVSSGASPVPTDITRATNDLAKDIAAHFKKPRQIYNPTWYECRGPLPTAILQYRIDSIGHALPGDKQRTVLFLYTLDEWNALLATYVQKEQERKGSVRAELQGAEQFRSSVAAERYKRTQALRANPKVGAETNKGMIVEVKPPLVLIQHRSAESAWTEWVKIESIESR